MVKNLPFSILLLLLLVACTNSTTEQPAQTTKSETQINQPINNPADDFTKPPTLKLTSTVTAAATATIIPTITSTPIDDIRYSSMAACIPKDSSTQIGMVTNVIDGDTIEVRLEDGNTYSVRYIGIDSAESGRPNFVEGRKANSDLVLQKEVTLIKDESEVDRYDRLLRYVVVDHIFVNLELLRVGFAQAMRYPPDVACADTFSTAENEARASFVGMWAATPTPEPSAAQVVIVTVNKREEWVDILNVGNSSVDLTGWNLVSERGNQNCPLSGVISAGETLRIWAMTAQGPGYSCGYSTNIWNNSEPDPAVLYNSQGVEVSRK
jgi:endonuclease YncB( thermonuclease family)